MRTDDDDDDETEKIGLTGGKETSELNEIVKSDRKTKSRYED